MNTVLLFSLLLLLWSPYPVKLKSYATMIRIKIQWHCTTIRCIYRVALFLKYFAYIGLSLWLYCDSPNEEVHVLHQLSILCNTSRWGTSTYRKLIDLGIQELQHPSYGKLKYYQSPGTNYIISQNLAHNLL